LPSVSVLPIDEAGRVLLVRHVGHDDEWGVLGGAVDLGESPAAAAVREAREEISVDVQLIRLLDVLGGPDYEVSYPNGDRATYVTAVYEARIISGSPAPDDGELSEAAWFAPTELPALPLKGRAGRPPRLLRELARPTVRLTNARRVIPSTSREGLLGCATQAITRPVAGISRQKPSRSS
jgi:ADP-ribose pyrophosphatase YjhB (NUDIX family)